MSLNYFLKNGLSEDNKSTISAWIKGALDAIAVESDDVFVQYIMVMVNSGKTMSEISVELEAFLGNPECAEFVEKLGNVLRPLDVSNPSAAPEKVNRVAKLGGNTKSSGNSENTSNKLLQTERSVKNSRDATDRSAVLDAPLSTGRVHAAKPPQGRLIQSALKDTLQPQQPSNSKRRNSGNLEETSTGFTTNKKNRPPAIGPHSSAPPPPNGAPAMNMMFDPTMMAQQMESYAQMMGFDSSASMMEFYNMSMMSMMQQGGMSGSWAGPAAGAGRWHDTGGRFRGRCVFAVVLNNDI